MLILIRFSGEISTKAKGTRTRFVTRLVSNIECALRQHNIPHAVKRSWNRLFVETESPSDAVDVLKRVFGIRSLSLVHQREAHSLDEICVQGFGIFESDVRGKRFAVRAKRIGNKTPPFTSHEIEVALGAKLNPIAERVDLENPEITAFVEVNGSQAYFFSEVIVAAGGLPLGAKGRGLALVSGGFDSAVAAWLILKRGIALDYVFLNMAGRDHLVGMLRVMKTIAAHWSYGDRPQLYALDFEGVIRELQRTSDQRYWQVVLKRMMFRAGQRVAEERGSLALITGEVIGQVSSQTLPNLHAISHATSLPIFRPLISFDKHEIVQLAKAIGTEKASANVHEYCALDIRHPVTNAILSHVDSQEENFDFELLNRAFEERVEIDLVSINVDALSLAEIETSEIPGDAQVLDLRPQSSYRAWHVPIAMHIDFKSALEDPESLELERSRPVVAYCEVGVKSAQLAEKLRNLGYEAYHFRGGMRELMSYAIDQELVPVELLPPSVFTD